MARSFWGLTRLGNSPDYDTSKPTFSTTMRSNPTKIPSIRCYRDVALLAHSRRAPPPGNYEDQHVRDEARRKKTNAFASNVFSHDAHHFARRAELIVSQNGELCQRRFKSSSQTCMNFR
jgi:hypothetical protein